MVKAPPSERGYVLRTSCSPARSLRPFRNRIGENPTLAFIAPTSTRSGEETYSEMLETNGFRIYGSVMQDVVTAFRGLGPSLKIIVLIIWFVLAGVFGYWVLWGKSAPEKDKEKPETIYNAPQFNAPTFHGPVTFNNGEKLPAEEKPPHKIESPRFSIDADKFVFFVGGASTVFTREALEKGPCRFISSAQSYVRLKDGRLVFNCLIGDGGNTIKVEDSTIKVWPSQFELNHNADWTAVEIVNEQKSPIFQLIYMQTNAIAFKGVLLSGKFAIIADDKRLEVTTLEPGQRKKFTYRIRPLFKYPAWKHPGEYTDPPTPVNVRLSKLAPEEIIIDPFDQTKVKSSTEFVGQNIRWALTFDFATEHNGEVTLSFTHQGAAGFASVEVVGLKSTAVSEGERDCIVEGTIEQVDYRIIRLKGTSIERDPR
jgi:hypothetical protein